MGSMQSGQMKMVLSARIKHLLSDIGGERTGLSSRTSWQSVGQRGKICLEAYVGNRIEGSILYPPWWIQHLFAKDNFLLFNLKARKSKKWHSKLEKDLCLCIITHLVIVLPEMPSGSEKSSNGLSWESGIVSFFRSPNLYSTSCSLCWEVINTP